MKRPIPLLILVSFSSYSQTAQEKGLMFSLSQIDYEGDNTLSETQVSPENFNNVSYYILNENLEIVENITIDYFQNKEKPNLKEKLN